MALSMGGQKKLPCNHLNATLSLIFLTFTYDTLGRFLMILPNWNVIASNEFTPSIVRAGMALQSGKRCFHNRNDFAVARGRPRLVVYTIGNGTAMRNDCLTLSIFLALSPIRFKRENSIMCDEKKNTWHYRYWQSSGMLHHSIITLTERLKINRPVVDVSYTIHNKKLELEK